MKTISSQNYQEEIIELSPNYNISLVLVFAAIPLMLIQPWVGIPMALFGLFLMLQTVNIRLRFSSTALDIYRRDELIRRFPYSEWENWRIFWQPVPILFYFKEVKSIHFLPILFNPQTLKECLEKYCPTVVNS
jgi:hypothetical protein